MPICLKTCHLDLVQTGYQRHPASCGTWGFLPAGLSLPPTSLWNRQPGGWREEPLTHQLTQIRGKTEELGGELGVPALALSLVFRSLKAAICRLMLTSVMGEGQWGHVSLLRSVLILPEMTLNMEDLGILALLYFVALTLVLHSDWTSRNTCWEFLSHHWISGPLVC